MPFTKSQSEDRSELHDLVYGWGKLSPGVPLAKPDRDSIWISTRSSRWPSTWPKPSPAGPSRRSSASNSSSSATTNLARSVHGPAWFRKHRGPWRSVVGP